VLTLAAQEAFMKKSILAATTAVILAGSAATYAVAQQPAPTKTAMEDYWRPSAADRDAFAAAHVAALHAGLALTPEQEQLWPPVEAVLKDMAKKREARMAEHRAERRMDRDRKEPANAIDRLRRGAERMSDVGNDLKRLADAAQPLYDKLDDGQKRRLQKMVRHGLHERIREGMRERAMHRFAEWRDRYRHWRDDEHEEHEDRMRNRDQDHDQDHGDQDHGDQDGQGNDAPGQRL
jgi:hypothetical protein